MIKDEIENKIQLETININKTIANKRRGTKSKEKNKLKGWPRKKEKEKKEIKKKKKQFRSKPHQNHHTCATYKRR